MLLSCFEPFSGRPPTKCYGRPFFHWFTCKYCNMTSVHLKDPPFFQVHTERNIGKHTVLTPCRIIGQAHRGLKCTTAVIVEQNIMFPYYHTMEYSEPAQLALGGLDWRTGPSNWPCVCSYARIDVHVLTVCSHVCVHASLCSRWVYMYAQTLGSNSKPGDFSSGGCCPGNLWRNPASLENTSLNYT